MGSLSIWHWLIVLAVVLLLFGGGGKISKLMGDFGKGLEKMLPRAFSNIARANRYATEGLTDRSGDTVISKDEFGVGDIVIRGIGFKTRQESEYSQQYQTFNDSLEGFA